MATKIVTKNSSTASAVPTASDLVQGELAVNVADKRLFTEDNAGAIVELGTNPSGNVTFQDNGKAIFGAGSDLQIYHDGSHSYVGDYGTGNLSVTGNNLYLQNTSGETYLSGISDGAVSLYHNNAEKLATTSTGINVTGNLTMASGGSIVAGGANDLVLNAGESGTPDIYLQSGSSTKVKIEGSNGNVGIGNSSPSANLEITQSGNNVGLLVTGGSYNYTAKFESSDAEANIIIEDSNSTNDGNMIGVATNDMYFITAAAERMRIDSSGNVGIGGNGTGNGLGVYLNKGAVANFYEASDGTKTMITGTDAGNDYVKIGSLSAHPVGFVVGNGEKMRIDSSGNVGIGTSSPQAKLDVSDVGNFSTGYGTFTGDGLHIQCNGTGGVGAFTGGISFSRISADNNSRAAGIAGVQGADADQVGLAFFTHPSATTSDSLVEAMRIDSSGNLLVNQTSVSAAGAGTKMQVATDLLTTGSSAGYFWENRSGMTISSGSGWGGWYSTGTTSHFLYSDGANKVSINRTSGTYTALSDVNKKKDFEDSSVGLAAIMQLQPKKFRMLDDADDAPKYLGFVAQDVENVIPEAYVEDTSVDAGGVENTFIGLTDRPFIAALVKAVQEQQTLIESLTSRIAALEE